MQVPSDRGENSAALAGRRVAIVGKLGSMSRREAQRLIREHGGAVAEQPSADVDLVLIGADELPLADPESLLEEPLRQAAAAGRLELWTETQLWQRLGLVESEQHVRRLYTPAMLADLLGVSVAKIRSWRRRGLIEPVCEIKRLPFFDFQEIATARRLAQLVAGGASSAVIEKRLAELARFMPDVERPLAQLSVIVEGKQILLRQGEGLVEPGGQMRLDFETAEQEPTADEAAEEPTLSLAEHTPPASPEDMLHLAGELEDEGCLAEAADMYRAALAAGGPQADICFQLAEVLYRAGDISAARERYYMTIEMEEDFVEARANLGCVLVETGELELAAAAFRGAVEYYGDYPDAHYHLARVLDELGQPEQALRHWRRFLDLAPGSPWASEAEERLASEEHADKSSTDVSQNG